MAAKSLSERTADTLYSMIMLEQAFLPGEKLPNENDLAEKLGVSRATLREAIRSLSAQGILEVQRGKGTYIAADVQDADFGLKELDRARVRLQDLLEMRLIFEPRALAFACERASAEELARIVAQGEKVIRDIREDGPWADSDQGFHMLIAKASHNEFMTRLFPIINSAVHGTMAIAKNEEALKVMTVGDNTLLLEFISRRDASGAAAAMDLHMRHVCNALGLNSPPGRSG